MTFCSGSFFLAWNWMILTYKEGNISDTYSSKMSKIFIQHLISFVEIVFPVLWNIPTNQSVLYSFLLIKTNMNLFCSLKASLRINLTCICDWWAMYEWLVVQKFVIETNCEDIYDRLQYEQYVRVKVITDGNLSTHFMPRSLDH